MKRIHEALTVICFLLGMIITLLFWIALK